MKVPSVKKNTFLVCVCVCVCGGGGGSFKYFKYRMGLCKVRCLSDTKVILISYKHDSFPAIILYSFLKCVYITRIKNITCIATVQSNKIATLVNTLLFLRSETTCLSDKGEYELRALCPVGYTCNSVDIITTELLHKLLCLSLTSSYFLSRPIEPVHEISNNVVCATSKASDQPAHARSLIRAFARRLNIL